MLTPIVIASIYKNAAGQRLILPARMALLEANAADSLMEVDAIVTQNGGSLYLSDAFRSTTDQQKAHDDYTSGRKKAYSPPPGMSMHEAGRAIDIDVASLGITLKKFWTIAGLYGWKPIITAPDPKMLESWHFEFQSYWNQPGGVLQRCAVLECYLFTGAPLSEVNWYTLAQGYLKVLGYYKLKVDGIYGPGTISALNEYASYFGKIIPTTPDILILAEKARDIWKRRPL